MEEWSMLIEDLKPEVIWETSCCAQWRSTVAQLNCDIGEILPQLAGKIQDAVYESVQKAIRLKKDGKTVYVYPDRIYIPYIAGEEEGRALMEWVREVINSAYSRIESVAREH
jgi:ArsR family metal-binding transcriptional regulator